MNKLDFFVLENFVEPKLLKYLKNWKFSNDGGDSDFKFYFKFSKNGVRLTGSMLCISERCSWALATEFLDRTFIIDIPSSDLLTCYLLSKALKRLSGQLESKRQILDNKIAKIDKIIYGKRL